MLDKRLLQSYIVRYDGKQQTLANAMGISLSSLNAKINETNAEFTKSEIDFIRERYRLDSETFNEIFFAGLVSKKDTRYKDIPA